MSKDSRRAARLARESRRVGGASQPGSGTNAVGDAAGGGRPAGGTSAGSPPASRPGARQATTAGARAGRRERVRPGPQKSFFERYRTAIVSVAAIAIVAIGLGYVFIGSTAAAFTCGSQFDPSPTPPVSPGSSARLGFFEDDMGFSHVVNVPQNYLLCPPASGNHYNSSGSSSISGPIAPRVYKPSDKVGPSNWLHNLEHGALVVLYRNDSPGATAAGQQAFTDFFGSFPPSAICQVPAGALSPVIARFDEMPHAYAALVWDRVLYLDTWDPDLVKRFYLTEGERLDSTGAFVAPREPQCAAPSASAAPSGGVAPSGSAPAASGSEPASTAPSPAASASPASSAAPS